MMTGLHTLSSRLPRLPATATAVSFPITWMQTMIMASHWVGLTLPGHDRRARLVGRQDELAQPAARARSEPADVVGDLGERHRQRAQRGARLDEGVVGGQGGELVGGRDEGQAGDARRCGRATRSPNSGWALRPVPTAVPPRASS